MEVRFRMNTNEKLNICLMNDSFPPVIDGVANAVTNYAQVINSELGSATVVTPAYPGAVDNYDFDVVRYKSINIEKICGYRAGYPFSSSNLESLREKRFDIIHSHCPFASTLMARVLREKTGVPLVLTYHTKFDVDIKRALPNELMARQAVKLVVTNISACDEVWTVSRGAGENLRSLGYQGEYTVMENGVDLPCGRANSDFAAMLRDAYGIAQDAPLFLFVGRLMWYKGIRLILDALKLLSESDRSFRMMFVGDGADKAEIEQYAQELGLSDLCVFAGAISDREELRVYYTAADLFLFPSEYDTNGIVVREAAACGVGALLIEGSCAAEGITHGRTGILCKPDPQNIAEELRFACAHRDEVRQIGVHAMNEVYISWETSVKRAYERYMVIKENMDNHVPTQRHESVLQEEFFSAMSSITDNIQRFRSINVGLREEMRDTRDKFKHIWHKLTDTLRK